MKLTILTMFLSQLMNLLSPEMIRNFVGSGLEWLEEKIKETTTEYDDATVIPIIEMIKTTLGINEKYPDEDVALQSQTAQMLNGLLKSLFTMLSPELLKGFLDSGLDVIENMISASETTTDDRLVLPIIGMIRKSFDIPDND